MEKIEQKSMKLKTGKQHKNLLKQEASSFKTVNKNDNPVTKLTKAKRQDTNQQYPE